MSYLMKIKTSPSRSQTPPLALSPRPKTHLCFLILFLALSSSYCPRLHRLAATHHWLHKKGLLPLLLRPQVILLSLGLYLCIIFNQCILHPPTLVLNINPATHHLHRLLHHRTSLPISNPTPTLCSLRNPTHNPTKQPEPTL